MKSTHGDIKVSQEPVLQSVNPAVHREFLIAFPRVARDRGVANIQDLLDDVQLAELV